VPLPPAAERHYAYQSRISAAVVRAAQLAWARVSLSDLDGSWQSVADGFTTLVTAAQVAAARDADPYLSAVLAEMGQPDGAVGQIQPAAFAGAASDGRGLASLLAEPLITVKTGLKARAAPDRALASGGTQLEMLAQTTVQDTGRAAVSAGMIARPHVEGYVRILVPPSCSRCVILAGRVYRYSTGFQRHPRCFPAGTVVSGPAYEAATRRWYQGELVVIRTAGGKELSATGNHPVLTDRGWVPANLLQEGDHVVSGGADGQGAGPLVVPDEHQMPARIEDLWRSGRVGSLRRVPTSAEDFHGDGGHGEVDVVLPDGLLWHNDQAAIRQGPTEEHLARRVIPALALLGEGAADEEILALAGATHGSMRGGRLAQSLLVGHPRGSIQASRRAVADLHPCSHELLADGPPTDSEALAEAELALAGLIGGDDLIPWHLDVMPRWDAPADPFAVDSAPVYASRGMDLLERLTGQVTLDRVVEVRRSEWSGHVYNLSSVEGWYNANGIIVSNCDCRMIPATQADAPDLVTDPMEAFRAGQVRGLSKAEEAAISDGADLNQIVNAHRSGAYQGMTTAEGVTKRGLAGKRMQGRQRLTVGAIQRLSSDRDELIRLLTANSYIL
jgi:hypothetical protein